ncbi:MAG TPA: ABC transporter substrate-binding protein [Methylomirabilota bacterium]
MLAFLSALGAPFPAGAQQRAKGARLGMLWQLSPEDTPQIVALREGLRDRDYIEGQNIVIEDRWARGDVTRFPDLAADLVRLKVDVIVATVNHAIQAARVASETIPIVMVVPSDPVGLGFVDSLARPGGNITGLTWQTREAVPKRLQLLKLAVPGLTRVAVLWDPTEPARRLQVEEAERAAASVGVQVHAFEVRTPQELEGVFGAMAHARAGAVLVEASAMLGAHRTRIAELAVKSRLATIAWWKGMAEAGCLLSYSPSIMAQYRRAAYFVAKILDGVKPADLPVEQPTTFEFIINLKTASALGLTIPPSLLARADHVIE